MSLHLITAPTEEVVTLEEAKKQLPTTADDDLVRAMIAAAVAQLDPASGGWLGRALRPQTWELRQYGFPYYLRHDYYYGELGARAGTIELPYPPLISVDSVEYDDGEGAETALVAGTGYRVLSGGLQKSNVAPIYNGAWPSSVRSDYQAVRIQFTAGHSSGPPDLLPAAIKQAVILGIRDLWSLAERNLYLRSESAPGLMSYEWTVSEMAGKVIRSAQENLLATYRVYD